MSTCVNEIDMDTSLPKDNFVEVVTQAIAPAHSSIPFYRRPHPLDLDAPPRLTACKMARRIQAPIKAITIVTIRLEEPPSPRKSANHPPMNAPIRPTTMSPTSP